MLSNIYRFAQRLTLTLSAVLAMGTTVSAQTSGRIVERVSSPMLGEEPVEVVIHYKAGKIRMDVDLGAQGGVRLYARKDTSEVVMVMPTLMTGYKLNRKERWEYTEEAAQKDTLHPTGRTEIVQGYKATEFTAPDDEGAKLSLWLTSELPAVARDAIRYAAEIFGSMTAAQDRLLELMRKQSMAPVRYALFSGKQEIASAEFLRFEAEEIPDTLFTIPDGIMFRVLGQ